LPLVRSLRGWADTTAWFSAAVTTGSSAAPQWLGYGSLTTLTVTPPLRAMSPRLRATGRAQQTIRLACALDPALLAAVVAQAVPKESAEVVATLTGVSLRTLTALSTGEIYAQARIDGFTPRWAVVALTTPGQDVRTPITKLAEALGGRLHAGSTSAWQLASALGAVHLEMGDGAVAVGSDPEAVRALVAGEAGDAPYAEGSALQVDTDLPAMSVFLPALQLLPFQAPAKPGSALERYGSLLSSAVLARIQSQARDLGSVTTTALSTVFGVQREVRLGEEARRALESELGGPLDGRLAWFADNVASPTRVLVVLRTAQGYQTVEGARTGMMPRHALAMRNRLQQLGCAQLAGGPDLESLPISATPPTVLSWLPPLPTLAGQLPVWTLDARLTNTTEDPAGPHVLSWTEKGLPVGTAAAMAGAWFGWRWIEPELRAAIRRVDLGGDARGE
jgi:hypothetical protein